MSLKGKEFTRMAICSPPDSGNSNSFEGLAYLLVPIIIFKLI